MAFSGASNELELTLMRLPGTPDPHYRWPLPTGVTIAADAWGPVDGPTVLLQHGGGQTRHAWKGAGRALGEAGYRAVAFDARGHGDSDWSREAIYTQDSMVEDLTALVALLGDPHPILVGASMGGGTSLVAIGEGHVDAAGLILVDVSPVVEPAGVEKIHQFMFGHPEGFGSLDEVADAITAYQPHRPRPRDLAGISKNVRVDAEGRYRWHWDPRIAFGFADDPYRRARLEDCARQLTQPTLLVRGGLSDVLSEEGARSFLEVCPSAEYVTVLGAAHMVAGDRNDAFTEAVLSFLTRSTPIHANVKTTTAPNPKPSLPRPANIVDIP